MQKLSVYAGMLIIASAAMAEHGGSGAVHAMSAWSPALPPVSDNGAVYLTLKNYGDAPDRLVGASSPVNEGDQIALTLQFDKASALELMVTIEPLGATEPKMAGHEHSGTHQQDKAHGHDRGHGSKRD